ncbi:hypothetical protein LOTGIDRAFT_162815 [Lottia gigantea]|uniref:Sushi domain-containing protein n=1 Tax=Lottia gigantea TaxID=225164 RepID=V3ZLB5_LOTGI|nr:hypothetical protein LOTGIDRAFT_162815 [Lottia gigantea]ESO92163.1 hypothetical protein LOTGIDRAFT_162815 [Lottia gigantea]
MMHALWFVVMFLSTLDLQDKTVYEWVKNVDDGIPKEPAIRKPRESTIQVNKVNKAKQFLQDLPKLPSHYCRSTSKKSYLEPIFTTFSELFKVYVDDCKQENKPFLRRKAFRSLFDDMSLAIHRPKKDKCDICSGFEVGNISEEEYNLHIARKINARNEKIRDKLRAETDGSVKVVSLDLQSLLLCPLLTASSMYYKTKLGCHNYTIFDLVTKEAMNYFWHEGIGDLNGSTFASCLADYILGLDPNIRELIIFSDGCTYQNRNTILSMKDCGAVPLDISSTGTAVNGTTYTNEAEYTCNEGFEKASGNTKIACLASGQWDVASLLWRSIVFRIRCYVLV